MPPKIMDVWRKHGQRITDVIDASVNQHVTVVQMQDRLLTLVWEILTIEELNRCPTMTEKKD